MFSLASAPAGPKAGKLTLPFKDCPAGLDSLVQRLSKSSLRCNSSPNPVWLVGFSGTGVKPRVGNNVFDKPASGLGDESALSSSVFFWMVGEISASRRGGDVRQFQIRLEARFFALLGETPLAGLVGETLIAGSCPKLGEGPGEELPAFDAFVVVLGKRLRLGLKP